MRRRIDGLGEGERQGDKGTKRLRERGRMGVMNIFVMNVL